MGKSKSRFHAAKQDRFRRPRVSTWSPPTPDNGWPKASRRRFHERGIVDGPVGTIAPSTDENLATYHHPPDNGDLKTRKREARRAKRLLVGSNYRHFAAASLSQGRAPDNTLRKDKKKQKHRNIKATVEKAPTDYGDERKTAVVYTDGACSLNGKRDALAGIGVWWNSGDERNLSERCPGLQTNNRAEIFAIVRLLEETPTTEKSRLVIRTDSLYTINCLVNWAPKWETQGWKTASGEAVKNAGMIRYLLALLSLRATQGEMTVFEHVRGHSNNVGNDGADALARRGATQPIIPERDWFAGRRRVESVQAKMVKQSKSVENPGVQDTLRFLVEPGDWLSFGELEELERTQEF